MANAGRLVKENPGLFEGLDRNDVMPSSKEPVLLNIPSQSGINGNENEHVEEIHDITHETEDDSLSIEKKEKELIIRALQKNNNKRKYAARDLGISERTLYRKIKQYELEE